MSLDGFAIPLEWPSDDVARMEMEARVQRFLEMRLKAHPDFEALLESVVPGADTLLARSVAEHWSREAELPPVVVEFLERFEG